MLLRHPLLRVALLLASTACSAGETGSAFDASRFVDVSLSDGSVSESYPVRALALHAWLTFGLRGYFDPLAGSP